MSDVDDGRRRTCLECGESFYVSDLRGHKRYCSVTCRNKAVYRRKCERAGKPIGRQVKRCEVCGGEFVASRSDVRFCSRKCRLARYRMTHPDYKTRQKHWVSDEYYEVAKVAVSALPRQTADRLRWILSTNCGEAKVLRMWLEDSDGQELKRIRERMEYEQ